MKQLVVAIILFLVISGGQVFAQGIKFQQISLEEAMKKAQKEDKLVFIDFYTDWCGPCKGLDKYVFPDENIGTLYNEEFINIKLNAEKEGRKAAKKYGVRSYPTMLFIDGGGNVAYKMIGASDIDGVIKMGKEAIASVNSEYSLANLEKQFPNKQNDEEFLKIYFTKMVEYGQDATEGIEAWLRVQTEIKESDVDMMEFLFANSKHLMVDGKAEEILYANYDEFWDIATRQEELRLNNLKYNLVENTKRKAYANKDAELMRAFITNWNELPPNKMKHGNLTDFEMDYLLMKGDTKAYMKMAAAFMDSITTAKTLDEIRSSDQAIYEDYKENKYRPSLIGNSTLETFRLGREANIQLRAMEKVGHGYLKVCEKSKDYKRLMGWIDYGSMLIESDYAMDNLRAAVLYKQGKNKEAIEYKTSALNKLSEKDKKRKGVQVQLDKMKKGEKL